MTISINLPVPDAPTMCGLYREISETVADSKITLSPAPCYHQNRMFRSAIHYRNEYVYGIEYCYDVTTETFVTNEILRMIDSTDGTESSCDVIFNSRVVSTGDIIQVGYYTGARYDATKYELITTDIIHPQHFDGCWAFASALPQSDVSPRYWHDESTAGHPYTFDNRLAVNGAGGMFTDVGPSNVVIEADKEATLIDVPGIWDMEGNNVCSFGFGTLLWNAPYYITSINFSTSKEASVIQTNKSYFHIYILLNGQTLLECQNNKGIIARMGTGGELIGPGLDKVQGHQINGSPLASYDVTPPRTSYGVIYHHIPIGFVQVTSLKAWACYSFTDQWTSEKQWTMSVHGWKPGGEVV